jgi:hypothetical protein
MTGFDSKRRVAQAKMDDDDDTQVYANTLLIVYQRGFADGKQAAQQAEPMTEVADRFAHRMAIELECVLADRNANWDRAMNLIGEYRSAMNAIHEQHSPTFMGEPLIQKEQSFEQKYPRNPNSTCKCEHWQACIDCHPTYIESAMRGEV